MKYLALAIGALSLLAVSLPASAGSKTCTTSCYGSGQNRTCTTSCY